MNSINLSAIVLAGGKSSRMGQDKALISIDDTPLLLRVCQVAQQCTDDVCVVSPWIDRYHSILPPAVRCIQEQYAPAEVADSHGPLVGFAQGLDAIDRQSDWVLLLACDLPYLEAEVFKQQLPHLSKLPPTTIAYLPRNQRGWWEPLCGFYRTQCRTSLEEFVQQGGRSFQRWLQTQMVAKLPIEDTRLLFNCNTPADLQGLTRSS